MFKRLSIVFTLAILLSAISTVHGAGKEVLTVAAAASNAFALKRIALMFEDEKGVSVRTSFGSSGMLKRQIEEGAPFDLFFSANIKYIDELKRGGLVLPGSIRVYAEGRIVLAVNKSSGIEVKGIKDLLSTEIKRIAIANPDHAPYGTAAMEAMKSAGVWDKIKDKLVYGENVRQTLQFIQSGNVPAGIVALSVAEAPEISYSVIDPAAHRPIEQAGAVLSASKRKKTAREFIEYVNGPKGRHVMRSLGFTLPGVR
ncbi:MAG: molybdate ABC transporter substrate-binding protein [Thermodesulfobacteriota bacterium]